MLLQINIAVIVELLALTKLNDMLAIVVGNW